MFGWFEGSKKKKAAPVERGETGQQNFGNVARSTEGFNQGISDQERSKGIAGHDRAAEQKFRVERGDAKPDDEVYDRVGGGVGNAKTSQAGKAATGDPKDTNTWKI